MKLLPMHLSLLRALSLMTLSSSSIYAEPESPASPAEIIYSLADVDKKPSAANMAQPAYPASMRETKTAGSAEMSFVIDSEGKIHQARAIKSTHRDFEEPAINAVLQSSWNPAEKGGKCVSTLVRIPITFHPIKSLP